MWPVVIRRVGYQIGMFGGDGPLATLRAQMDESARATTLGRLTRYCNLYAKAWPFERPGMR
jgi:hypothetical protein